MTSILRELRFSARQMTRRPTFTVISVLTLALGIGATSAILGVVDRILFEPLPYPDSERIVTLWQAEPAQGVERGDVAPANFLDWRARSQAFDQLVGIEPSSISLGDADAGGLESVPAWQVTRGFFEVLAVPAMIGRTLEPSDYAAGGPGRIVLGYRIWRSRFAGDPQIVGRRIAVEGAFVTVVGVMPPEFDFPAGRQIWMPRPLQGWEAESRTSAWWQVVGELKPGVSPAAAGDEMTAIAQRLAREHPETNSGIEVRIVGLRDLLLGHLSQPLMLLVVAAGIVLFVACLNAISMLLGELLVREREFAVLAALGANRWHLFRRLFAEGSVLAAIGGVAGCALAVASLEAYQSFGSGITGWIEVSDAQRSAVVYAAAITALAALVFATAPMSRVSGGELRQRLQSVAQSSARGTRRFWQGLVVVELLLAVVLLVGAGLLVRSYLNLLDEELGYRVDGVVGIPIWIWDQYPDPAQRVRFAEDAVARLAASPGVEAAAATSSLPLAPGIGADQATFSVEGRPEPPTGQWPDARVSVVTRDFFAALEIPVIRGRSFRLSDQGSPRRIALVNEAMVDRHFGGLDPIGRTLSYRFGQRSAAAEIVGVVGDVRHAGLNDEPRPALYLPHFQIGSAALWLTARGPVGADRVADAVKASIRAENPGIAIRRAVVLEERLADSLVAREVNLFLLIVFGATALSLAAVGTYGVLSQEVRGRRRELGIRLAVGASRRRILTGVLVRGIRMASIGIVLGVSVSVLGTRLLTGFLHGVDPMDGFTLVTIAVTVLGVSLAAGLLPGWRAANVDAVHSLRQD